MLARTCSALLALLALLAANSVAAAQTCTSVQPFAELWDIHAVGDEYLLIRANEGLGLGTELYRWRADTGVTLVKDIDPGPDSGNPSNFATAWLGGELVTLFQASDAVHGRELWRTDGTSAGTYLVKDVHPPTQTAWIFPIVYHPGLQRAFFGSHNLGTYNLWSTDGTAAGTQLVEANLSFIAKLLPVGDHMYFIWEQAGVDSVYRTDGTPGGATLVATVPSKIMRMERVGEDIVALVSGGVFPAYKSEMFHIDTQAQTAALLVDSFPGANDRAKFIAMSEMTGEVYFRSALDLTTDGVFRSDLTPGGTHLVTSLPTSLTYSFGAFDEASSGNLLLVPAVDQSTSKELVHVYDTLAPSAPTELMVPGPYQYPRAAYAGDGAYFVNPESGNSGLFFTDGTVAGTVRVCALPSASGSPFWLKLVHCDGNLFFMGLDASGQLGLQQYSSPGASSTDLGFNYGATRMRSTDPTLGSSVTIEGEGAPPGSVGVVFYGAPLAMPLDFGSGMPNWIDFTGAFAMPGLLQPTWSLAANVPSAPSLAGGELNLQAWFIEPGSGKLLASNGLRLHLEP